jgi:hypothetical protein
MSFKALRVIGVLAAMGATLPRVVPVALADQADDTAPSDQNGGAV